MDTINFKQKFSLFSDLWSPKIVGELNGQNVKLVKLEGEFVWHEDKDEMFFVVKGNLKIEFRDEILTIQENEFSIVPRGIEHKPVADSEVWVMLFEPSTTLNTGNTESELTQNKLDWI